MAGREKDRAFVRTAFEHGLVEIDQVLRLLALTPIPSEKHRTILKRQMQKDALP